MGITDKFVKAYINHVYNRFYDITTARISYYPALQRDCISRLNIQDNDSILCVGLGTGNELFRILEHNKKVKITGIDLSEVALQKASQKSKIPGSKVTLSCMDAKNLSFSDQSFNKVLCIHVMDFVDDWKAVTREIMRVLKKDGHFVITFPSQNEGLRLGVNLVKESVRHHTNSGKKILATVTSSISLLLGGIVYLPLMFRRNHKSFTFSQLTRMMGVHNNIDFQIEEDSCYLDFIVCGEKKYVED